MSALPGIGAVATLLALAVTAAVADEPPAPTTRPAEAARAHPNTWIEFTPAFHGAPRGGRFVAVGWNKMVYDSKTRRAIIMDRWKDADRDLTIYANAVIAIDPDTARAEVLKLTNHKRQETPGGGYRTVDLPQNEAEPTPVDRHPYGCLTYSAADHSIYLGPGANRTAKRHPRDLWRLDLATRKWHRIDAPGDPAAGRNLLERVMCYDPADKVILFYKSAGKGSTYLFDVVKQQWRQPMPTDEPKAGMGAAMAYDSKRQVVYLFAGPGSKGKEWNTPGAELWSYSVKRNEWKRLADSPVPARAPAIAYDSAHDLLLASIARRGSGRGQPNVVLLYHPATDAWSEMSRPKQGPWPRGTWDTLCYDASRDLFLLKSGNYDDLKWLAMHYEPATSP